LAGNAYLLTDQAMKLLAIVIVSGVIAIKLSHKLRIPDTILFILIGIIIGPEVSGLVSFQRFPEANQFIFIFGAAYIFYIGGREVNLKVLNRVKISVALLATIGVIISAFITGYFAQIFLHLNYLYALLLGSVIAPTDPSVLVPLFNSININPRLKQTIISESAFNDAVATILTFTLLGIIAGGSFSIANSIVQFTKIAGGGIIVGVLIGYLALLLVSEHKYGLFEGHKGEIVIAAVLGAFFIASNFGCSGFMAVFVVGIVFGNKMMLNLSVAEEGQNLYISFQDVLVRMLRITIFVILGTEVSFHALAQSWKGALVVVLLLIFVARPVSVIVSVIIDRKAEWSFKEVLYLIWTRETGVIPAALAGILISMHVPGSEVISTVTFMAILITLALQATPAKYFAQLLNLVGTEE
jgi:NhaP-type Na+/H+ or K+/H+ antiporter